MKLYFAVLVFGVTTAVMHAGTKPVPTSCTPDVNSGLGQFLTKSQSGGVEAHQDNVMVCGTMLADAIPQHAGHSGAGAHHVLVLQIPTTATPLTVEVVTNDSLDGVVTGKKGNPVYAYGQAFWDPGSQKQGSFTLAGGLHEPHCATHAGADDGWVVVAGTRYPRGGCSVRRRHHAQ